MAPEVHVADDIDDDDALELAILEGDLAALERLLPGVDLDAALPESDQTPFITAVDANQLAVAEVLLKAGARVDATNTDGETALLHALDWGQADEPPELLAKVKWLLAHGASASASLKEDGEAEVTVLGRAIERSPELPNGAELVAALVDAGVDLYPRREDGTTPLHDAAGQAVPAVMHVLVERGLKVTAVDKQGRTPLHALVVASTVFDGEDDASPIPEDWSEVKRFERCIGVLVAARASLNAADVEGKLPADLALEGLPAVLVRRVAPPGWEPRLGYFLSPAILGMLLASVVSGVMALVSVLVFPDWFEAAPPLLREPQFLVGAALSLNALAAVCLGVGARALATSAPRPRQLLTLGAVAAVVACTLASFLLVHGPARVVLAGLALVAFMAPLLVMSWRVPAAGLANPLDPGVPS